MDAIAGLLAGPRAQGAFLLRCVLSPPWSLRIQDEAPLSIFAVVQGDGWVAFDGTVPVRLGEGDVVIVRGPEPYTVSDGPSRPPQVVIHPGERCASPDGRDLAQEMHLGVRSWGNDPDGQTVLLTGTYPHGREVSRHLLAAIPPLIVLSEDAWDSHVVTLLRREINRDDPGQEAVLDRLLDLLLITALRAWFARPDANAPAWYLAQSDPVVGTALRLLHNNPAHPWTVALLAAETHVSRASFARRFNDLVGEPPMSYLTNWRLRIAADLLREPGARVAAVAEKVGYGSPYALSTAFTRAYGVSPRAHRAAALVPALEGAPVSRALP